MNKFSIVLFLSVSSIFVAKCCQSRSKTKFNPILEFSPQPDPYSTLIWYKQTNSESSRELTKDLKKFLEPYTSTTRSNNAQMCNGNELPSKGKFCDVFLHSNQFRPCVSELHYGFHREGPCVFLKLNVPEGWMPDYYNVTNLPKDMPKELKEVIRREQLHGRHHKVWVTCEGENPADIEYMGPLIFFPQRGFPGNHFANNNVQGYTAPLVAVFFERPSNAVLLNIECTAWARNIRRDREAKLGKVHFELMID